jgi:hypothetical protein
MRTLADPAAFAWRAGEQRGHLVDLLFGSDRLAGLAAGAEAVRYSPLVRQRLVVRGTAAGRFSSTNSMPCSWGRRSAAADSAGR